MYNKIPFMLVGTLMLLSTAHMLIAGTDHVHDWLRVCNLPGAIYLLCGCPNLKLKGNYVQLVAGFAVGIMALDIMWAFGII